MENVYETEIQNYLWVQLPLLSTQFLQKHRELRLAHMALSAMTMGYTWQDGDENLAEVRDMTTLCTFNRKPLLVSRNRFDNLASYVYLGESEEN